MMNKAGEGNQANWTSDNSDGAVARVFEGWPKMGYKEYPLNDVIVGDKLDVTHMTMHEDTRRGWTMANNGEPIEGDVDYIPKLELTNCISIDYDPEGTLDNLRKMNNEAEALGLFRNHEPLPYNNDNQINLKRTDTDRKNYDIIECPLCGINVKDDGEPCGNCEYKPIDAIKEYCKHKDVEVPVNIYLREIKPGIWVDFYDIADAFEIHDSGMAHAFKKILAIGKRGHKNEAQDRKDIFDSVVRSNQNFNERGNK